MKFLALVLSSLMLFGCGGGGTETPLSAPVPTLEALLPNPVRNASTVFGANEIAIHVYQALYGQAPGNTMLASYVSQIGTGDGYAWAESMTANLDSMSDSAFSTLVLNNISLTPTSASQQTFDAMHEALMWYFQAMGVARRGTVVVQLSEILSNLEGDGSFGGVAILFNKQISANLAYSADSANTLASVVVPPSFETPPLPV